MNQLPRIRAGLLRHPLDKQDLVYDTRDDRIHLLDPTTACVLELLKEGGWTREGITAQIAVRLDVAPNAGFLPLALEELRKAGLLDEAVPLPAPMAGVNRRELVRKLAMTGAAALLVPTIATLTATRGYAQGSPTLGVNSPCSENSQCISLDCCYGTCVDTGLCPRANGAQCGQLHTCASGVCSGGLCVACTLSTDCADSLTCTAGVCG
jgi:hypothetical protein